MLLTREDVQLLMIPQSAHGVEPASPNGLVIPWAEGTRIADANKRNLLENKGIFADGFKRKSLRGNFTSAATLSLAAGFNWLGWALLFVAGEITSTADAIARIKVTNGGSGYTAVPTVSIVDANGAPGTGATAVAVVKNEKVVEIIVTASGSGYHEGETTVEFAGGGGGVDAAATAVIKTKHEASLTNTLLEYILEAGAASIPQYYQFYDQVVTGLRYGVELEGQLMSELTVKGSGLLVPAGATLDGTPTELVDEPADHSSWQVLQDGSLSAIIEKMTVGVTIAVPERRAQNDKGLVSEFKRGSKRIEVGVDTWFESDDTWQKARDGILVAINSTCYDGDDNALLQEIPEIDLEPVGPELPGEDGGVMQSFRGAGVKHENSLSPIKWTLFNDTANYTP